MELHCCNGNTVGSQQLLPIAYACPHCLVNTVLQSLWNNCPVAFEAKHSGNRLYVAVAPNILRRNTSVRAIRLANRNPPARYCSRVGPRKKFRRLQGISRQAEGVPYPSALDVAFPTSQCRVCTSAGQVVPFQRLQTCSPHFSG